MTDVIDRAVRRRSETKVQIPWSSPVEKLGMRSKVKQQAEKDAKRLVRTAVRESFGVEPVEIAERVGVEVREAKLDEDILGALYITPGTDPRLVVNRRLSFLRRRFICALELGHYIHMSAVTSEYKRADVRDKAEERGGESDDRYALEFAGSLLMPREDVELLADLEVDDLEMALRFFVPRDVMQARLRGLGLRAPAWRSSDG